MLFSLDPETSVIEESHRKKLLPVLMRSAFIITISILSVSHLVEEIFGEIEIIMFELFIIIIIICVIFISRILYGKMLTKTGTDTSGRTNVQVRKNIVMRFLGGCKQDELSIFLNLIFEPLQHLVTGQLKDLMSLS